MIGLYLTLFRIWLAFRMARFEVLNGGMNG